jgi:hypothetical protein
LIGEITTILGALVLMPAIALIRRRTSELPVTAGNP